MRLLQADGLVTHRPHHGMVVALLSQEEIGEIYRLRVNLEPLAGQWAAERAGSADIAELRRIHEAYKRSFARGPAGRQTVELNTQWHQTLYSLSGSPLLQEFISRLWAVIPIEALYRSTHGGHSTTEHEAIMLALENGRASEVRDLLRSHIEGGAGMHDESLAHDQSP